MSNELSVMQSQGGIVSIAIDSLTTQVLQNADDGVELSVLDIELVESVVKASKSAQGFQRATLYWIRQKKGYLILNYESFEAFGLAEFGLEKSTLHSMANAHHIQTVLEKSNTLDSNSELPIRSTNQLNKLSDAEIPEAYQAAIELAREEGKKLGAKHIEQIVNEWKFKNESLQNDLVGANQAITEKEKRVKFLELDRDTFRDQNTQLRNDLTTSVESKVNERISETRAMLILENQQALAESKRIADNAKGELANLKKEQATAIADGVTLELNKLDTEIKQKLYKIEMYERDLNDLKKVKCELDAEVGALAIHKEVIKNIKDNLSFLTVSFSDAFDTGTIPPEVFTDWQSISYAVSKLNKQLLAFVVDSAPIESTALVGELVDIETPWDDELVEVFA